jgi:dTDP-4-amino-4,6-dideoxygalactose transaminase
MSKLFHFLTISQQKLMVKPWHWLLGFIPSTEIALRTFIPKPHLYWTSSARNALYLLLIFIQNQQKYPKNQKKFNKQLTVAIPAFTCQVVKEAADNANCNVIFYDNKANAELIDIKKILQKKPDILILSYNFGYLPKDTKKIANLCKKSNTILIEDCAQALGAKQNNILAGGFGEFAIYSFGISKNIAFSGGILASNSQLTLKKPPLIPIKEFFSNIIQSIFGPIVLSKLIFPITKNILHQKISSKNYYPKRYYACSKFSKNVICNLAKKYYTILKKRQENFKILTNQESKDACLYFNIVTNNKTALIKKAANKGIELDQLHSFKFLPDKIEANDFPKATYLANNHLAIALYRSKKEIQRIKQVLP